MSFAIINSRTLNGISAAEVAVEVHLGNGLPSFTIVGLAQTAIKESRDRVRSAIINSNFKFPAKKITVNLAPADLPKEGTRFDLPIAIGILLASDQIPVTSEAIDNYEFIGELALNGRLRAVCGVLPVAHAISRRKRVLALPGDAAIEAALINDLSVVFADSLNGLLEKIVNQSHCESKSLNEVHVVQHTYNDLSDIKGQILAKRALEIAASGRHNLIMVGPPGCGKTMLATGLPGIMPELTQAQAIETASIYSISRQGFDIKNWRRIPMRSPHHSCTCAALVGGGTIPLPGEVSLAHNGILFLDELSEFDSRALDMLREPLENGIVRIARINQTQNFLADFLLIAAANPCHCGYLGSSFKHCKCSPSQIEKYTNKFSGPLIDRFDMHIELTALLPEELMSQSKGESSLHVAQRVLKTRTIQYNRQGKLNCKLTTNEIECELNYSKSLKNQLQAVLSKLKLSARSFHRLLRLARTIADMDLSERVGKKHINESLHYRYLDRQR